jgi:hypothetical protein
MRPETLEKVLERMATTDKVTLVCEKAPEGKIRVTSGSWAGGKVILKGQVLEVRMSTGCCTSLANRGVFTAALRDCIKRRCASSSLNFSFLVVATPQPV